MGSTAGAGGWDWGGSGSWAETTLSAANRREKERALCMGIGGGLREQHYDERNLASILARFSRKYGHAEVQG